MRVFVCVCVFTLYMPLFDVILCCYVPLQYYYYFFVTGRKLFEIKAYLMWLLLLLLFITGCAIFKLVQMGYSIYTHFDGATHMHIYGEIGAWQAKVK